MNIIKIDLSHCKYLDDMHQRIQKAFHFPEWYGKNWDAFWDLLNEPREDTLVYLQGVRTLQSELKSEAEIMISFMEKNKQFYAQYTQQNPSFPYHFDYEIMD